MSEENEEHEVLLQSTNSIQEAHIDAHLPRDRYNLVYISVFILGFGALLPWNMFINAKGYFSYQLRNTSLPADQYNNANTQTSLQIYFESSLAVAYMVTNVLGNVAATLLAARVSVKKRIISCLLLTTLILLLTFILTKTDASQWQVAFFAITMASTILLAVGCSVFGGSLYGLLAAFPPRYIQSGMAGGATFWSGWPHFPERLLGGPCFIAVALAGVFSALADILTISLKGSVLVSGFWYFMLSVIAITIALAAYNLLYFLEYSRYCFRRYDSIAESRPSSTSEGGISPMRLWTTLKDMSMCSGSVFLVSVVTLMLFPATTSSVQSENKASGSPATGKYFIPVYCFLLFNVGDLAGRALAAWVELPKRSIAIPLMSFLRLLFIPLFILCNAQPRSNLPVIFNSDVYPIVFMAVFALTNGYLMTRTNMIGPRLTDNTELGGLLMCLSMTMGLAVGSWLSYAMVYFVSKA